MEIEEEQKILTALKQLASKIKKEIDTGMSKGSIQPGSETNLKWKVNKFEYNDQGLVDCELVSDYNTKKLWLRASNEIKESIKKCEEYSSALKLLSRILNGEKEIIRNLNFFVSKLVLKYLDDPKLDNSEMDVFVATFLKDIKDEPLNLGAKIELEGIIMLLDKIEFKIDNTNILLRKIKPEDLEKELPVFMATQPQHPSAILNINFLGRKSQEIQIKVEQAIAILRLFKVGSIKSISYQMYSESITDPFAHSTLNGGNSLLALEKSKIVAEDGQKLKNFWRVMINHLPLSFYKSGEMDGDPTTIAYQRYCEALLHGGVIERRIANGVMGLESLFLKHGASYTLKIRTAKIFGLMGYNPLKVREIVNESYKVRNLFVHGGQLSDQEKTKLNAKFGNVRNLLLLLLDYLRISISIMIITKKKKGELIRLIEDALVSKDKDGQLNSLLNNVKKDIQIE